MKTSKSTPSPTCYGLSMERTSKIFHFQIFNLRNFTTYTFSLYMWAQPASNQLASSCWPRLPTLNWRILAQLQLPYQIKIDLVNYKMPCVIHTTKTYSKYTKDKEKKIHRITTEKALNYKGRESNMKKQRHYKFDYPHEQNTNRKFVLCISSYLNANYFKYHILNEKIRRDLVAELNKIWLRYLLPSVSSVLMTHIEWKRRNRKFYCMKIETKESNSRYFHINFMSDFLKEAKVGNFVIKNMANW